MIYADCLVDKFKLALSQGWGYIYGSAGETWTKSKQDGATRQQTIKWGSKWIGKRVADCSGLFAWAFRQLGSYMYHGSNTMFKKYSVASGQLKDGKRTDGQQLQVGSAVYKYNQQEGYHHVGLYIGDGDVIQAKGTYYGVVKSNVSEWHYWSQLVDVDYANRHEQTTEGMEHTAMKAKVTTTFGSLNLRKSQSTSASRICTIPNGSVVDVYDNSGDWWYIGYQLDKGYAMSKYLTLESQACVVSDLQARVKRIQDTVQQLKKKIDQCIK